MSVWSAAVYGIRPERIIGCPGRMRFMKEDKPTFTKTLDMVFVDEREGKSVNIHQFVAPSYLATFGNCDGDRRARELCQHES